MLDLITDSGKELDRHIKDYKQFRENVIAKFFGSPISITPNLAEIRTAINEITIIKNQLADKSIPDSITTNKKSIEDLKKICR